MSAGFEIETELTVHALEMRMPFGEVGTPYKERPPGSTSKLSTFKDGFRILFMIGKLVKEERPLASFAITGALLALLSLIVAAPVLITYYQTGLVPRLPTAVLAAALMILAFLSVTCGLILQTVTQGRRELKRLTYLSYPAPQKPKDIP